MMIPIPSPHCSDHQLTAHCDGELPWWQQRLVVRHLRRCWHCRSRLQSLEEEIIWIAQQSSHWTSQDWASLPVARARLTARMAVVDRTSESPHPSSRAATSWLSGSRRTLAAAASAACIVIALLSAVRGFTASRDPWRLIQEQERQRIKGAVVRQRFALELNDSASRSPVPGILEITRDNHQDRYAVLWRTADGQLLYGLWRPNTDREFVYSAGETVGVRPAQPKPARNTVRPSCSESDSLEGLERSLTQWLESRARQPILLTRDCLCLPRLPAAGRQLQPNAQDGSWQFRWEQNKAGGAAVLLDVDRGNLQPQSQRVQWVTPSGTRALRLRLLDISDVPPERLPSGYFEPNPLLVMAEAKPLFAPLLQSLFHLTL